jgi:hypothetical protein
MKKWEIRFRVISPSDYNIPLCYLPIESTIIEAETEELAWEKWVTDPYAAPRDWYKKIEINQIC